MVPNAGAEVQQLKPIEEATGKLKFQDVDDKLMHSVLENDKKVIEKGKLIENALSRGIGSFNPDMMFEQLVKDYRLTEQIYGQRILRELFGYEPDYIEKNIQIPEFQREIRKKLNERVEKLKDEKLIDKHGEITNKGIELASLVMYVEELDNIVPRGIIGEKVHKKKATYGSKDIADFYKKGDRYRDISIKKSAKTAIRRGHSSIEVEDLKVYDRKSKGQCYIIYALDASGSMKGDKISTCKKAGVALAYKAIREKDKVGLIVFGKEVRRAIEPTHDFARLLREIITIKAASKTDISATIKKSIELFPDENVTRHLLLLTDALPTAGKKPQDETLEAVSAARSRGITVSMIGINLNKQGKEIAEKITQMGNGRLYVVKDLGELDRIVLEDYYGVI